MHQHRAYTLHCSLLLAKPQLKHAAPRPKANTPAVSRSLLKAQEHHPQSKSDLSSLDAHTPHTCILLLGGALASAQDLRQKTQ